MQLIRRKHLGQKGFIHHVIPILAFVALFASMGAYFLLRGSHAATPSYRIEYESTVQPACITNQNGRAELMRGTSTTCYNNGSINPSADSIATITDTGLRYLKTEEVATITVDGGCMQQSNGSSISFTSSACSTSNVLDEVVLAWPYIESYETPSLCVSASNLGSFAAGAALILSPCDNSQNSPFNPNGFNIWKLLTVTSTTPTTSVTPPKGTTTPPPKNTSPTTPPVTGSSGSSKTGTTSPAVPMSQFYNTAPQACYGHSYSTANVNTAYYCVAAFQTMLNGMNPYDHGGTQTVDGQFGSITAGHTTTYQNYENQSLTGSAKLAVNGQANPKTWQFLCWSMWNRKLNTTGLTGKAYTYAECTSDGVKVGVKP